MKLAGLIVLILTGLLIAWPRGTEAPPTARSALPPAFERNVGQVPARFDYLARGASTSIALSTSGAEIASRKGRVALEFAGGRGGEPQPGRRLPGVVNHLVGDDPSRWRTGIPTFERVRYPGVWPGVDVEWHGGEDGLEYDFRLAPRADPSRIALRYSRPVRVTAALKGKAVIVIHGIIRSSNSFAAMEKTLATEGYEVIRFDYPSTRVPIQESADSLNKVIESLEGIEEINFVVHSMGGLVVRQSLTTRKDPRIGRLVMLGVPNHGANLANMLKDYTLFKSVYGPAGQQLVEDPGGFIAKLPTPEFPFAVVAGGKGSAVGFNPWIAGDDDGTVAVVSTRLPGATDFMMVPTLHSFLMSDEGVIAATSRFLKTGCLSADGVANPIPRLPSPVADPVDSPVVQAGHEIGSQIKPKP